MIQLPDLFRHKLAETPRLESDIRKNLDLFEPWLEQSGMPFFPGFTDHSPRHINDVLGTAASLISDTSHDLLTSEDVAVLCIAILLHDCGMHLTHDGFRALVSNSGATLISGLHDSPWPQLWSDFLGEANRFGQEKLIAIFGDTEPVRSNELNLDNLSERDCLLIGEFVRRHHTRLAHEIALAGVPNKSGTMLQLTGLDEGIKDLAGLTARSHGMSIRDTFGYIKTRYGIVAEQRRIKTPFLMAVLRIADYVQVQSERALKALLSVKELRSPVSRQEWRTHFAVQDISTRHEDPEALYVHATPTDVKTYLKLDNLFNDIQHELDESWATIGEVYGRGGDLAQLGLTLRRIRSNLDSKQEFSRTVPYIPIRAGFNSSGPDLLKLLVGPLYDYKYEIGIRELVQNAVDACRELSDLAPNNLGEGTQQPEDDVIVDIRESADGTGWITVTDKGIGMTLDTVTNYFLIAGASFRNSDLWKRQHVDEFGRARVIRGGRFGVGALASFLLGDEIKVKTRHVDRPEQDGLEFRARIDEPTIELRRCSAPAGTSIEIRVTNPKVLDKLRPRIWWINEDREVQELKSWPKVDWFAQSSPRISYQWKGYLQECHPEHLTTARTPFRGVFRPDSYQLVPLADAFDPAWRSLTDPNPYKAILWQYIKQKKPSDKGYEIGYYNEITVNGIRVETLSPFAESERLMLTKSELGVGPRYHIQRPSIAIFDPMAACPINLQRSAVSFDQMGIDSRLAEAILTEHLIHLMKLAQEVESFGDFRNLCSAVDTTEGIVYPDQTSPICASSKGIFLSEPTSFEELQIEVLFLAETSSEISSPLNLFKWLQDDEALVFRRKKGELQSDLAWFRGITSCVNHERSYRDTCYPDLERSAALLIMPLIKWKIINEKGRVNRTILKSLKSESFRDQQIIVMAGNIKEARSLISRTAPILDLLGPNSEISAWKLDNCQSHAESPSLLKKIWFQTLRSPYLKYSENCYESVAAQV